MSLAARQAATQAPRLVPGARSGQRLSVFLGQVQVGVLERRGPGRYRFSYMPGAEAGESGPGAVLSASLPRREQAFTPSESAPFFEGLLPEGAVRTAVARTLGLSEEDGFGLLGALGADCAGAVVVLPEGEAPRSGTAGEVRALDDNDLATLVAGLSRHPLGVSAEPDGVRLSLGGVQEKLVLSRSPDGRFGQPLGGTPSTCLLKPDYGRYEGLAVNEAFCMRVAAAAGLDAAATEIVRVGAIDCLYAERFDRRRDEGGGVERIHQEDMCQALGVLPVAKYEQDGGPSVAAVVGLLRSLGSQRAALDINAFVRAVLLDFLLGNSDAHGKNFALLHDSHQGTRLAPLYDVVSTGVYEGLTERMAMTIGGEDDPAQVDLESWRRLAEESGLGGQLAGLVPKWADEVLGGVREVREAALFEGWHQPVIDRIAELCRARAAQLGAG